MDNNPVRDILTYVQMDNSKKGMLYCEEALQLNEHSLHGLYAKAKRELDNESFEACIGTLNTANEHHQGNSKVQNLLNKAQIALKRSKEKDYYKVLGVAHDADERQIKAAYRKMTRLHHPDKAVKSGYSKEDAERKMASINEAYEVLSDPELRARFDRGDDPNSHERPQGNPFGGNPFGGGSPFGFQQQQGSGGHHQFHFQQGGGFPGGFPFGG
jgi:DnaJ family protein C protein 3